MAFDYPRLLGRLINRPLLVTPQRAKVLLGVLGSRAGVTGTLVEQGEAEPTRLEDLSAAWDGERPERRVYQLLDGGIARVPVVGTLVAKLGTLDPWSGMTGYDGLRYKLAAALGDPEVEGILLDIESPGGELHSQLPELADAIRAARETKPVWAMASDIAYSAAYWLGAQAERLYVPDVGGVGSVGVVLMHADFSRMFDAAGITVTLIHAGAHKVDGNSYEPLPDDVREELQAEVEDARRLFAEAVAEGRGLTVEAVLATEARALAAQEAVSIGFADGVMSPEAVVAAFREHLSGATAPSTAAAAATITAEDSDMSDRNKASLAARRAAEQENSEKKAAPGDQPGDGDEEEEDGEMAEQAAAAERQRIAAILEAPEAKGREALARHFAFATRMSPEGAKAALAVAPKSAGGLAAAMAAEPLADVGHDGGQTESRTAGLRAAVEDQVQRLTRRTAIH